MAIDLINRFLRFPVLEILIAFLLITFLACKKSPQINTEIEKQEVIQFIKDYSSFVSSVNIENFDSYWNKSDLVSYIPLERDSAIIGYKEIVNYFKNQFNEVNSITLKIFNPVVWVSPTKSEALVIFLSSKNLQLKNGFNLTFQQVRNSMLLTKFEGKWKIISLHESVRQR